MGIEVYPAKAIWAQAVRSSTQTIPDVTTTVITYTAKNDPWGMINTGTGTVTLPVAGFWSFSLIWSFNADVANWNHCAINNTTASVAIASLRTASGPYINTVSGNLYCAKGDIISASMYADTASGATLNYARMTAVLLGT